MNLSLQGTFLPPSSSLPPVRSLLATSEDQVFSALRNLQSLYCPLRLPASIPKPTLHRKKQIPAASTPVPVDSGYASQDEDDEDGSDDVEETIAALRADPFEKSFATRWLTTLLARAEEFAFEEDVKERIIDDAALVLASFSDSTNEEGEEALTREFSFASTAGDGKGIQVTLNDAPLSGTDHTDVGLQSWGASIVLSSMMCADPARFGLEALATQDPSSIIELGAGTGLISLMLAKLLPKLSQNGSTILATDYHPAVLDNLRANVATNFPSTTPETHPVQTSLLDWSAPPSTLHKLASLLIAADVVYAPEHASWLRDCAAHLLTPGNFFWLMVTVRQNGKFEGIADTVEAAFVETECPRDSEGNVFKILEKESVEKRRGVGRGDESGYLLYKIGWEVTGQTA